MTWRGREGGEEEEVEEENKTCSCKENKLGRMKIVFYFCANTTILVL